MEEVQALLLSAKVGRGGAGLLVGVVTVMAGAGTWKLSRLM
jgi:hypothetical protein